MPKKKANPDTQNDSDSDFIDFVKDKSYTGVLLSFGKLPSSNKDGTFFYYATFEDGKKVALSSVIGRKFRYAVNSNDVDLVGSRISIEYLGSKKTANKRNVNLYAVTIEGKLIDENEVSNEEITNIFNATETDDLPF